MANGSLEPLQYIGEFMLGIGAMISAGMSVINWVIARHVKAEVATIKETSINNAKDISDLTLNTNGKLDKLLVVTGEAEHAKGVLEEKTRREL